MKLQVAFDLLDLEQSLEVAKQIEDKVDQFEIDSLLLHKYGIHAIEKFKELFPQKTIIADTKIVDRGKDITNLAINAGADWVTVMAGADKQVIHSVCTTAAEKGKQVILDLLDTTLLGQAAMDAKNLGINTILFHQPHDQKQDLPFSYDKWTIVRGNTELPIYISANINKDNINNLLELKPQGLVVHRTITKDNDPVAAIDFFLEKIKEAEKLPDLGKLEEDI